MPVLVMNKFLFCSMKAVESDIVYSEKMSYSFLISDEYDLFFFSIANRGYLDNSELNFFPKSSASTISVSRQMTQMTSHYDVTFELL